MTRRPLRTALTVTALVTLLAVASGGATAAVDTPGDDPPLPPNATDSGATNCEGTYDQTTGLIVPDEDCAEGLFRSPSPADDVDSLMFYKSPVHDTLLPTGA